MKDERKRGERDEEKGNKREGDCTGSKNGGSRYVVFSILLFSLNSLKRQLGKNVGEEEDDDDDEDDEEKDSERHFLFLFKGTFPTSQLKTSHLHTNLP